MFRRTKSFLLRRGRGLGNEAKTVIGYEYLKSTASGIGQMVSTLFKTRQAKHEETFRNAYRRLDLNETKLADSHRYHTTRFYIFAAFAALALGVLVFGMMRGDEWTALTSVGILALMGSLAFQASFVLYQIQRREMVDVSEWLCHPAVWIPAAFMVDHSFEQGNREPGRQINTTRNGASR